MKDQPSTLPIPLSSQPELSPRRNYTEIGLIGILLLIVDLIGLAGGHIVGGWVTALIQQYMLNAQPWTSFPGSAESHLHLFAVLCTAAIVMFWSKGLYTQRMPWWSQVLYITKVIFLVFLFHGFLSFALKSDESRLLIFTTWSFSFLFILLGRSILCKQISRMSWWKIPVAVIADNALATDLVYAFNADPFAGYSPKVLCLRDQNFENFDRADLPKAFQNVEIRDGVSDIDSFIRQNPSLFYVISLESFRGKLRERVLDTLNSVKAGYAIVPSISRTSLYEMEPHFFFGHDIMMLEAKSSRITNSRFSPALWIKRLMDIAISGIALLALAPMFLVFAAMLKIEGQGGSIFYGGERIGRGGKRFKCWKFRSMEPDSNHLLEAYLEANPDQKVIWEKFRKLDRDPRVTTHTAYFIRKASIDELPQLWNVLVGDMSLIGPRPILDDELHFFEPTSFNEYMSVRPGLTGLWQVSGRNATSFARRVYWDSWYVRNWSLWGDIVILIKTPLVLLSRNGVN